MKKERAQLVADLIEALADLMDFNHECHTEDQQITRLAALRRQLIKALMDL